MLSPGEAFLLAYLPSRHATLLARKALLERLSPTLDPKLRHAVDFHREALQIYTSIIARTTARVVELAAHAGIVLPAMPPPADGWRATLAKDAQRMMALPDLQIAWEAGEIAGDVHRSAELLADLAYLRAAAPENPELRGEAEQAAADLKSTAAKLGPVLESMGLPLVTAIAGNVAALVADVKDLTPTTTDGHKRINRFERDLTAACELIARTLDQPPPRRATAPPSPRELELLAEIIRDPAADAPRREFAELAAQRKDPRAEVIREQLAREAAAAAGDTIAQAGHSDRAGLIIRSHPEWLAPLTELGARDVKFHRGFPAEVTIDAPHFLDHGAELLARAPITQLHIRGGAGRIAELVDSPLLDTIEVLDLDDQHVTDDDLAALAASPFVKRLRRLDLRFNTIGPRGIEALAASPKLRALDTVNFGANKHDPVDRLDYSDDTNAVRVPTEAGKALEAKYGRLAWLHPEPS